MGERVGQIAKVSEVKQSNSNSQVRRTKRLQSMDTPADHILYLQRTAGNQAVSKLMKSGALQAKLRIGQPGDVYEQEADRVADAVMRMPEPGVQRQPIEDEEEEQIQTKPVTEQITPLVQRQVEEEEEELQMKVNPSVIQHQEPEEDEILQGKMSEVVQRQPEEEEEAPLQANFASGLTGTLQTKPETPKNNTGMPDHLKSGLENLSNMNLSNVRVHHNSPKPAQLNALAYTQGQDIHVGSGQEKHLPHEGWHAVQQIQGRVKPTMHANGVSINDDSGLEREADAMGEKALQLVAETKRGPAVERKTNTNGFVIQRVSPLADAVRLIQANSSTTGASIITEDLITGIRQAENMFLRERPFNRWGGSLGLSDTVGPGQLGEPAITDVDRNFSAAATAFAAIHGAAPSDWRSKATDTKWSYFYIAGYLAYSINRAESVFHPAPPVLSNADLGVMQIGIAIYHGAYDAIVAMRRRIASERGINVADVTWAMVQEELRSGTATHKEMELEQYTQLAQGSWEFEFDITARLPKSRRFQIQNGKLEVTVLANYQNPTSTGTRGTNYRIRLRRYAIASGPPGMIAEGFENHGSFSYNVGSREVGTWTGLPRGDYYLVIEKIEDNFSPDRLIGNGIVKTIF